MSGPKKMKSTLSSLILHPIRVFREDLRSNPLSRLTWGIEPANKKRWRKICISLWVYPIVYVGLILSPLLFDVIGPGLGERIMTNHETRGRTVIRSFTVYWGHHAGRIRNDPRQLPSFLLHASIISMYVVTVLFLILSAFGARSVDGLQVNSIDYRMAGMSGAQMLFGAGGPRLVQAFLMGVFHLFFLFGTGIVIYSLAAIGEISDWHVKAFVWLVGIGMAPVFAIVISSAIELPMRVLSWKVIMRLIAVVFIGILASPLIACYCIMISGHHVTTNWLWTCNIAELLTWPVRGLIVAWIWRKAVRKLGGED